jgi:hypothetical protein
LRGILLNTQGISYLLLRQLDLVGIGNLTQQKGDYWQHRKDWLLYAGNPVLSPLAIFPQ